MLCPSFNTSNRSVSGTDVAIGTLEVAADLEKEDYSRALYVSGLVSGLSALSELDD